MITGHYFKRLKGRLIVRGTGRVDRQTLLDRLFHRIVEQFGRFSELRLLAIPLDWASLDQAEDPPATPLHPACAEFACSGYCCESWQLHMAELRDRPQAHWHKCDYGRLCAVVPLMWDNRLLGAIKLACADPISEECFANHVELLDAIVKNVVDLESEAIEGLLPPLSAPVEAVEAGPVVDDGNKTLHHAQVERALEHIEARLVDPQLTVSRIAGELDIHPDYLAHLFVTQVGQRMSHYIATRRILRAKNLLATTDWSVQQVAARTGFANRNWFHHVFRVHVGQTPREYRREAQFSETYKFRLS